MESRKVPTEALMLFGALAVIILFQIVLWITKNGTGAEFEFYVTGILAVIASFLLGSTGLVVMMRREFPQLIFTVRGYPAVFFGFIMAFAGWGMTLMGLYQIFAHLFERIFS